VVKIGEERYEYTNTPHAAGVAHCLRLAMTHMSREFSLVLLGAGLLTAGYFLWPEEDFEQRAEEQASNRVGGHYGRHIMFIGHVGGAYSVTGRPGSVGSFAKGGLGSIGSRVAGGGG
jgi:hypothetical protein